MAKVPEPKSKLDVIHDSIIAELIAAGIVNEEKHVLDQAALEAHLKEKIKKLQAQLDETVTEWGEIKDQYAYNMIGSEIDYLNRMITQKTLFPASESPYPESHKVEKYFETKQTEKKEDSPKRVGFFKRLFGHGK